MRNAGNVHFAFFCGFSAETGLFWKDFIEKHVGIWYTVGKVIFLCSMKM